MIESAYKLCRTLLNRMALNNPVHQYLIDCFGLRFFAGSLADENSNSIGSYLMMTLKI